LVRSRLAAVPVWVWLEAIVFGSAVVRLLLAGGIVAPFIMVDELIWAEIARGLAHSGEPLLRDQPDPGYSLVYPLLISPVYALFESLPDAYAAVKAVNAALMSLAAVPAYFLSRRVVGKGLSLVAALLTVAIPSMAFTGTVMTENAFYPLFIAVTLVLVLVLEQPTAFRVALLVALVGLAFATRVQALAVVPAVLLAPLVLAMFDRRGLRATIDRYRILYGVVAALAVLVVVGQLAGGRSPEDLLGAYSTVGDESYEVGEVLRYLVWHVAEFALYLLVIPVAATIVLVGRARSLDRPLQTFLAALVALTVCVVPVVAAFASEFSGGRIEERNLFYLAPIFVIALLAWIERGAPRPRILAPTAAAASGLLVLLIPFDRFLTTSAITDTLMLLPFWSLQDRIGSGWITPAAFALATALAAAFLFLPRRYAIALPLVVLGLWVVAFKPIWWGKHGFERFSRGSLFQGIRTADRDWIDGALPDGSVAAFLWTGRTDRLTVNENEFFNRDVGPVYYIGSPTPGGLPETRVTIDRETGAVTLPDGSPVEDEYVISDSSFEPDGVAIASDRGWGITLWRADPPLVSALRIDGLYSNDTWSGETVKYVRRRCRPGRLVVGLSSDASLFLKPQTVVARTRGKIVSTLRLPPGARRTMRVRVAPDHKDGECGVDFTVTPTAVPSEVTAGANPDDRELGAHFNRFVYTPRS
jgi:dolichyl-phosphate-mannose-protein mannosyltransferase